MRNIVAAIVLLALPLCGCTLLERSHQTTARVATYRPTSGGQAASGTAGVLDSVLGSGDILGGGNLAAAAANALLDADVTTVRWVAPTQANTTPSMVIVIDAEGKVTITLAGGQAATDTGTATEAREQSTLAGANGLQGHTGPLGLAGENLSGYLPLLLKWVGKLQAKMPPKEFSGFCSDIAKLVTANDATRRGAAVVFAMHYIPIIRDSLGPEDYAALQADILAVVK